MLRLLLLLGNAAAFALVLSACSTPVSPAGPAAPKKINEQDNGSTVTLQIGQQLEVSLAANPTTGYEWEVASVDSAVIKQAGEPKYVPEGDALGSGGKTTFRFDAIKPGQTLLQMIYRRPFEKDTPPVQTFEVTVVN